jgi:hypothetical protein
VAARSDRCLLIGLDVPFLGLGSYAPDGMDLLLVPRTSALLTAPDDHAHADDAWHRLGDLVSSGTVGTDQVEYGLKSLYKLGYSTSLLQTAYTTFRDLPHSGALAVGGLPAAENSDGGTFGASYDAAACWTGYFRLGTLGTNSRPDRFYGTYYDSQGWGTLAGFKALLYPEDYEAGRELIAQTIVHHGALLDESFDTRWSAASTYDYATKGTIPIASAGIGLLDALEGVV